MSPEERNVDIQPEAIQSQPSRPNKPESVFAKALRRGVQAAVAIATVLGISGDAEARDVSDEELSEVASELGFTSIEAAIEHTMIDPRDISTQLHPDGSGRMVFSYKRGTADLYHRLTPTGEDTIYPPELNDEGGEIPSGLYRFQSRIGSTVVAKDNGGTLNILVDERFRPATTDISSDLNANSVYEVLIGEVPYMIFHNTAGHLVKIPVADVEAWTPESGDIEPTLVAENIFTNIVALADGMVLAQQPGVFTLQLVNLDTGTVTTVDSPAVSDLGGPFGISGSAFYNDPSTDNAFWVHDLSEGTFEKFDASYLLESVSESYTATLEIDGTHMGLDAIPAGTSVRVEVPGRPDITQVSTGSDMTISIPDLTEETTITVTVTFPDGVLVDGESVLVREFTVSPEDAVEEITFDSENEVVVTTRMVTFNLQIHNEAEERDVIEGGSAPTETNMDEGIDTWSTDSFELRDPGAIAGANFERVGDGQYTVTVEIVDGEPVVCDVINTTEGTYVGSIAVDSSQRSVSADVPVLTPVTENTPIDVHLEASGEVDGDATIRLVTNGEPGEPVTVSFAPDGSANHTFFAYGVNPDDHDDINVFEAQVQVDGAWVGLPELMSEGTFNVAMGAGNESLNPEALMQDLIVAGPVQFGGNVELNGNGTDANVYLTPILADGRRAPEEEIGITNSFGVFNFRINQVLSNGSVKLPEEELEAATGVSVTGGVLRFEDDLTGVSTEITIEDLGAIPADLGVIELTAPDQGDEGEDTGVEPEPDTGVEPEPDTGVEPEPDTGVEPEPDAGQDAFVDVADAGGGDDVPTTDANPDTVADAGMDTDTDTTDNGNGGGGGKGCATAPAPTPSGPLATFIAGAIAWYNRRRRK